MLFPLRYFIGRNSDDNVEMLSLELFSISWLQLIENGETNW